jgi:GNAT superfamily N-acetyltransferase
MDVEIFKANPENHAELTQIARASKGYWGYPEAWISAWSDQLRIYPETIEKDHVYQALVNGETAGFYVLSSQEERLLLDHLWIKPEYIGQGIGRVLFEHALRQAAGLGARQIEIEADPNALAFYLKMGAYQIGVRPSNFGRELPLLIAEVDHAQFQSAT